MRLQRTFARLPASITVDTGYVLPALITNLSDSGCALETGLLLGQAIVSPAGAQRRPAPPDALPPETALVAPPLISAVGAGIPVAAATD